MKENAPIRAADFTKLLTVSFERVWKQAYGVAQPCKRKLRKGSRRAYWAAGPMGLCF